MSSKSYITILPARHTLALGLIMVTMTMMMLTVTTTTTSIFLVPPLVQSALADHGQEVVLSEKESSFAPISSDEGGNQVKVAVNYDVRDPMIVNDLAKAVMKVYSPDGTLVKTSSSPTPFRITDNQGTVTLATTLTDATIEGVTAKIVFTNPIKTETISNELAVSVDKGATLSEDSQEKITPQNLSQSESLQDIVKGATLPEDSQEKITPQNLSQSQSHQDVQIKPLSEELEEVPIIQGNQQGTSIESMSQTTSGNPSIPQTTTAFTHAPYSTEGICDDGIDNDSDTLIDLSDGDCNQIQPQQQATLQQEQTMGQTPEVCGDGLDNDLDGKIDSGDEECNGITTSSSTPSTQAQSFAEKQIGEEDEDKDEDKEQQSDEDTSEKSGEKEDEVDDDDEDEDEDSEDDDNEEDE